MFNLKLKTGEKLPLFIMKDIYGNEINLEHYAGSKILLSFYRFAACPFCNLRVHQLIGKVSDYEKQGLKIISFWQSTQQNLLAHVEGRQIPFPMIADHERNIYREYGIESDWRGSIKLIANNPKLTLEAMKLNGTSVPKIDGDMNLIPADFLINPDLTLYQAYYGAHIGDHIPFADIEKFIKS